MIFMPCDTTTSFNCPVEATIHLIGGKYKAVILWQLKDQVLRYSELHKLVPKATPKCSLSSSGNWKMTISLDALSIRSYHQKPNII